MPKYSNFKVIINKALPKGSVYPERVLVVEVDEKYLFGKRTRKLFKSSYYWNDFYTGKPVSSSFRETLDEFVRAHEIRKLVEEDVNE